MRREAYGFFGPNGENPFHETRLGPGQYYPCISRPIDRHPHDGIGWNPSGLAEPNVIAIARGQLKALIRQLEGICQTIHPEGDSLRAFGHDIRNLLILACTEVETHWRGVLVANSASQVETRLTTAVYVKLNGAMKLDHYTIAFPSYPWLPQFGPFEGWGSTGKPTQELPWYDAYNATKHDRESCFGRATLGHVFEAISACMTMLVAQFGLPFGLGKDEEFRSFFQLTGIPSWPPSDVYLYPYDSPTGEWRAVNYPFE